MRAAAPVLAVAVVAALAQLPLFDRTMSLMDEGHILQFADIVARGGELYRDATLLPLPGGFYLLAGAFELFGPSIRVARWLVVFEFAALCALVFALLRRMVPGGFALLAVGVLLVYRIWAFPHWHMYSYSTTAQVLLLAALYGCVRFLESEDRRWLAGAGLATGLGVFCKQDYGGAVLIALGAVLVATARWRTPRAPVAPRLAWYVAPAAAVGLATALHFLRQGLLGELLQQTVFNHLFGIASFEYTGLPPLLPLFGQDPMFRTPFGFGTYAPSILFTVDFEWIRTSGWYADTILWDTAIRLFFYAPYGILAAAAWRLWRRRADRLDPERGLAYARELAFTAFAAALFLALNRPVDYVHVAVLYWPLLCLLVVYAHAIARRGRRAAVALALLAGLPALVLAGYTVRLGWLLRDANDTPLRTERAGVSVASNDERVIGEAVDYVRQHSEPGERIAVLPYFPLISFLAGRDAPHRSIYTFWPVVYIEDRDRQIIRAIDESGADFLIYHFTQFVQFPRMSEYAPELFAWLVDQYELETVFTDDQWGYMLAAARRSEGPPPGRPILDAALASASLHVEGRRGRQPIPAARRAEFAAPALWPFRPVVALRPGAGGRRTVLSVPVDVPAGGARLETSVGIHPTHWFRFPPRASTFSVRAVHGGDRDVLALRRVDPHRDPGQRRWFDLSLPLDAYAGRRIELELAVEVELPPGEVPEMGGFGWPRLVAPDAGEGALEDGG